MVAKRFCMFEDFLNNAEVQAGLAEFLRGESLRSWVQENLHGFINNNSEAGKPSPCRFDDRPVNKDVIFVKFA